MAEPARRVDPWAGEIIKGPWGQKPPTSPARENREPAQSHAGSDGGDGNDTSSAFAAGLLAFGAALLLSNRSRRRKESRRAP